MTETDPKVRMLDQVRNGANPEVLGVILAHTQRVVVAEAERSAALEPMLGEGGVELFRRADALASEQLARQGAGVFDVDVEIADEQAVPGLAGIAQSITMAGVGTSALGELSG